MLYINGQFVPTQHYSIQESGSSVVVTIVPGDVEFSIDSGDQVVLTGKVQSI